jgi:hypothetical protein
VSSVSVAPLSGGRVTRSAPRHAGVRHESPARLGAPHEQRKPAPMASPPERHRAARHARRRRGCLPSRMGPSGSSSSCASALERSSKPRRPLPTVTCGRSPRKNQGEGEHAHAAEKACTRNRLNPEPSGPDRSRSRIGFRTGPPRAARKGISAERHIVRACGARSDRSWRHHPATMPSAEPRCDRNRAAASGSGGAVARGASRKSPAAPQRRGQKSRHRESRKVRCFERLVLGGSHARPGLRSRPLHPPAVRAEARPRGRLKFDSSTIAAVFATTWRFSRWAGLVGACLAPHLACRLRQSRNSWNSSGLATGGLPATPCCCFIKSLNFARSSGSCAFLSSHS